MSELTLPQRLLVRIGEISRRSDVIVHRQTRPRGERIGRWQGKLPADMFAFYQAINGLTFHYGFADAPDGWHGLQFVALDDDGRKTIDTVRHFYRIPRQAAKRYPEHFFQPGAVSPETPVLFFFGSDDAWGVIMQGEGESATFHHWDNDGFVRYLAGSFTELIERLIARGFAHTWAYSDSHPDTDDVVRRLAIEVAPRTTCQVTIESVEERPARDYRLGLLRSFSEAQHQGALRALGRTKEAKGLSPDERLAMLEGALSSLAPIPEKVATAVMKAFGYHRRTRDELAAFFQCDAGPVAYVKARLEHVSGPPVRLANSDVLLRALHAIEGLHVTEGCPLPSEVLAYMDLRRQGLSWSPFVACSFTNAEGEETKVVSCNFVVDAARARGMVEGKTYASSGLLSVEQALG